MDTCPKTASTAPLSTLSLRSRARSTTLTRSLLGSSESVGRGRTAFPPRKTKPGRRAAVVPVRPGPGRRWMTTGGSPPLSTYFYATVGRLRPSKSSSGVSRHARIRRWKTGALTGSASEPPLTRPSLTSLWTIGRRLRSGSISRSFANNGLELAYFVSIFGP